MMERNQERKWNDNIYSKHPLTAAFRSELMNGRTDEHLWWLCSWLIAFHPHSKLGERFSILFFVLTVHRDEKVRTRAIEITISRLPRKHEKQPGLLIHTSPGCQQPSPLFRQWCLKTIWKRNLYLLNEAQWSFKNRIYELLTVFLECRATEQNILIAGSEKDVVLNQWSNWQAVRIQLPVIFGQSLPPLASLRSLNGIPSLSETKDNRGVLLASESA